MIWKGWLNGSVMPFSHFSVTIQSPFNWDEWHRFILWWNVSFGIYHYLRLQSMKRSTYLFFRAFTCTLRSAAFGLTVHKALTAHSAFTKRSPFVLCSLIVQSSLLSYSELKNERIGLCDSHQKIKGWRKLISLIKHQFNKNIIRRI